MLYRIGRAIGDHGEYARGFATGLDLDEHFVFVHVSPDASD
jgi:hypothetical protein